MTASAPPQSANNDNEASEAFIYFGKAPHPNPLPAREERVGVRGQARQHRQASAAISPSPPNPAQPTNQDPQH
ncbi:hypothetical protein C7U61_17940 [Rhizobium sp. JAB6]|nr:hypothetical protein C7U61_17940 [Rhizobium sp. JAB6]